MMKLTVIKKNDRLYFGQKICIIIIWLISNILTACSNKEQLQITGKSPYISKVFEYKYAPGQHASLIDKTVKGDDFIGKPWINGKSYTSLGGWGGYIIAGFDHEVINGAGNDFAVFAQPGAGSEPGVVYVMSDLNGDGLPNDGDWIELKGSELNNNETIRNYQVTYFKPVNNGYVTWADNKGNQGALIPVFDSSSWWWAGYGDKSEIVFSGVKLPNAYENTSQEPGTENWAIRPGLFSFGYAECYGNTDYDNNLEANLFDISDAIDGSGNPLVINGIDFIKVQSGVFQIAGWLNEVSTEITGAVDLSLIGDVTN
jgi:hypothetical protein